MSARPPVISVLMSVFNAGKFLDASIRSIVSQTFQDWEFLIVDDASSDGSVEVVKSWAEKDRRIQLICNGTNQGQTPCLNQGLQAARGRWVARQDADDLSHPLRLTRQFERVTVDPDLVLLGTCGRIIDANDRLTGLLDVPLTSESIRWTAPLLNPFLHTSVMFRRDVVLDEFGGYDESFRISQDYDLWTRLASQRKLANLPWRLVCYRNLVTALSKVGSSTAFNEAMRVSEREEIQSFGRELTSEERQVLAAFREGMAPEKYRAFLRLYGDLIAPLKCSDKNRLMAGHHLKLAGAVASSRVAMLAEIASAFRRDPAFVARWLIERWQG